MNLFSLWSVAYPSGSLVALEERERWGANVGGLVGGAGGGAGGWGWWDEANGADAVDAATEETVLQARPSDFWVSVSSTLKCEVRASHCFSPFLPCKSHRERLLRECWKT